MVHSCSVDYHADELQSRDRGKMFPIRLQGVKASVRGLLYAGLTSTALLSSCHAPTTRSSHLLLKELVGLMRSVG